MVGGGIPGGLGLGGSSAYSCLPLSMSAPVGLHCVGVALVERAETGGNVVVYLAVVLSSAKLRWTMSVASGGSSALWTFSTSATVSSALRGYLRAAAMSVAAGGRPG